MFHDDIRCGARRAEKALIKLRDRGKWNCGRLKAPTRNSSLFSAARSDLAPTQSLIPWESGVLTLRVNWLEREAI